MQIEKFNLFFVILFVVFCSGCTSSPAHQLAEPLKYTRESDRIDGNKIIEIPSGALGKAEEILMGRGFAEIEASELNELAIPNIFSDPEKVYLVKSIKDDGAGKYSAFFRDGHLIILYNHFGTCNPPSSGFVIISLPGNLKTISSGCSGAI
ncbi:hypothetical protein OCJ37_20865 [Xanthomonas sp. AM6]|uniref:hypothetical protein n=1 Tax=Xanthomonas sp. AM6 TaxID=2982531 RepID=UPI0021D9CA7F|nr:hypothetical protein [Xanthomonas sp. AM6]UYB52374.1 hypothetical protein OCJ37_20865 [Xanthomonas sp. AM6]